MERVLLNDIGPGDTTAGVFSVADYLDKTQNNNECFSIAILNTRDINFDFTGVDFLDGESFKSLPLVSIFRSRSCLLSNISYVHDYKLWEQKDWKLARDGVLLRGIDCHAVDTHLEGVRHGVFALANNSESHGAFIQGFSGDALRACAHYTKLSNFNISEHYKGDQRLHGDAVQVFPFVPPGKQAYAEPLEDIVIQNGHVRNLREKPGQNWLQGITQTDGRTKNILLQNINILTDHELAVLLNSCIGATLDNVVVLDTASKATPRIQIGGNKSAYKNDKNTYTLRGSSAPEVVAL